MCHRGGRTPERHAHGFLRAPPLAFADAFPNGDRTVEVGLLVHVDRGQQQVQRAGDREVGAAPGNKDAEYRACY